MEVSSPRCYPSRGFRPHCGAGRASSGAESGGNDPRRANADPPSKRSPRLAGSLSRTTPPPGVNRQGMAEDGEIESQRLRAHPVSGRGQPPGWFILQEQKATDSNGTVSPAHPLATEPSAPVWFTFHGYRPGDSNPDRQVPKTCASANWARTASDRRDSNSSCELGELACLPLTLRSLERTAGFEPRPAAREAGVLTADTASAWSLLGESNPRVHAPQACPSASCGTSAREPPPGVEPGRPPYEGGAASRARRHSWPSWPRTRKLRVQSAAGLPDSPNGHRVRETRFERAGREV
jgi:hypothetical protein